ncbi:polysaccharide export protein [Lichenihabitans sp. PAMC28606]|uniref:polysaccharide biosynthesis/export family protein n=1 Tax=Lichenihabitans sp. PAMC28606 TaxID=2880932 RepID=UPI001D0B0FA9|nr:polysaccharide biosynthesis/export family protein [Lichenihabitans sp. PAMC28606]UDL96649.1 polysaccharide export protein [Lichenihabitans sp. PAMC28606]
MVRGPMVLLALCSVLAGCSSLPSDGPSAKDVLQQSKLNGDEKGPSRYEIVDIDSAAVSVLRRRAPDGFSSHFGDYRPSADLRIGVGDYVTVTIWEAGANGLFSAPLMTDRFSTGAKSSTIPDQAVGRDGTISVPYAGRINVKGQTTEAVQHTIEVALEGKAIQPQVLVNVSRPISNTVTVTGEVAAGARVPLTAKGDRILDVVATAGGVRAPVNETVVRLSRGSTTVSVPMTRVVSNPRENVFMRPGDVLTLVRDPQYFLAYGATNYSQKVPFEADSISLSEAIAKVGGLQDQRADPSGVFVFRYEPPAIARALRPNTTLAVNGWVPVVYRLDMRDPASLFVAQGFPVFNKDIVFVSNAPITEATKAFQIFNLVASPVSTGASLSTAIR